MGDRSLPIAILKIGEKIISPRHCLENTSQEVLPRPLFDRHAVITRRTKVRNGRVFRPKR